MRDAASQVRRLLRLAELRETLAQRDVALARRDAHEKQAQIGVAMGQLQALAREQEARRAALRNPLLGTSQLRGVLASVLTTFEADRGREADGQRRVEQTREAALAAQRVLDEKRALVVQANRVKQKRKLLNDHFADRRLRMLEAGEERESEDFSPRVLFDEEKG